MAGFITNDAIPHTFGAYNHVVQVDCVPDKTSASHDNDNKVGAIPHTFGAYNHVTEVECLQDATSAGHDNHDKDGAIPHTFGAYEHVTEVEQNQPTHAMAYAVILGRSCLEPRMPITFPTTANPLDPGGVHNMTDGGTIRLRGNDQLRGFLMEAQRESYSKDGYIVLPGAITDSQAADLLEEAQNVIKRISTGGEGITRHDMSKSGAKRPSPIGRVLATFEPEDTSSPNPFLRRIARLGLSVHQKLPTFRTLTHSLFNRSLAASLGYTDPRITQSQLIAKLAGIGGELVPHQDGCVSFTNPPTAMTFWYALEDANTENGCLEVAMGSHLTSPLRQRLVGCEDGVPRFVELDTPLWAKGSVGKMDGEYEYQALEVKKGTLILFHGNLMHRSGKNGSGRNRMAYTFSIVEGGVECPGNSYVMPEGGIVQIKKNEPLNPPINGWIIFAIAAPLSRVYWWNSTVGITLDTVSVVVTQYNNTAITGQTTVFGDLSSVDVDTVSEILEIQSLVPNPQEYGNEQALLLLANGTDGQHDETISIASPTPYIGIAGYQYFSQTRSDPDCPVSQVRNEQGVCGCPMTTATGFYFPTEVAMESYITLNQTYYSSFARDEHNDLLSDMKQINMDFETAPFSKWLDSISPSPPDRKSCYIIPAFFGPPAMKVPVSALTATVTTTVTGTQHYSWSSATPALGASTSIPAETSKVEQAKMGQPTATPVAIPIDVASGLGPYSAATSGEAANSQSIRTLASPPSEIISGDLTYTLGSSSEYIIASSIVAQSRDSKDLGSPVSLASGQSVTFDKPFSQSSPKHDLIPTPILPFLRSTYTMDISSKLLIDGQTITPGGILTILGSAVSVPHTVEAHAQSVPEQSVVKTPVISFAGLTYTMTTSSNFILGGQTIRPGGAVTVSGTVLSRPSGNSLVILGGVTQTLSEAVMTLGADRSDGSVFASGSASGIIVVNDPLDRNTPLTNAQTPNTHTAEVIDTPTDGMATVKTLGGATVPAIPTPSGDAGTPVNPADTKEVQSIASNSKFRLIPLVASGACVGLGLIAIVM
ncbi:MAG: hypothetical protein Q9213_007331 [Squamulea squamosa]